MLIKLKNSYRKQRILSALDAYLIFRELLMELDTVDRHKEHMWVMALTNQNTIVYIDLTSIGTLTSLVSGPREIYAHAIRHGGVRGIILCHNHPSGNIKPSPEDAKFTQQVKEAGKILGIDLIDHLVISLQSYYSFEGMKKAKGGKDE